MSDSETPRSGRRNLIRVNIVLGVIDVLLLAAVVFLFVFPGRAGELLSAGEGEEGVTSAERSEEPAEPAEDTTAESDSEEAQEETEPAVSEEDREPAPEESEDVVEPQEREPIDRHAVEAGDTFYDISAHYWGDEHLWPDLYMLNRERFSDPDFMRPGEEVVIYPSLASDGELSDPDVDVLTDAYIDTYTVYRELGMDALEEGRETNSRYLMARSRIKINKAHWLLYSGHRFNESLLEDYNGRIDERDARVVEDYLERFGLPGTDP